MFSKRQSQRGVIGSKHLGWQRVEGDDQTRDTMMDGMVANRLKEMTVSTVNPIEISNCHNMWLRRDVVPVSNDSHCAIRLLSQRRS